MRYVAFSPQTKLVLIYRKIAVAKINAITTSPITFEDIYEDT